MNLMDTKKLGFGLMRLPKIDNIFDIEQIKQMVDAYMNAGFNYFDTAYVYEGSEAVTKQALVDRYPRDSYTLATKLHIAMAKINSKQECLDCFETQLERTGAGYFDYYLTHSISSIESYNKYKEISFFDFIKEKKVQGKIKHIGFSFHGDPDLLKLVLDEQPETEFVQIQVNYLDWDSKLIHSGELYKILRERNIPIIIMEPVKGGALASMSPEIESIFKEARPEKSIASWALRYTGSLDGIMTILSGMSNMEQMLDNLDTFTNFEPLSASEQSVVKKVTDTIYNANQIACTACNYCIDGCPQNIEIPKTFTFVNAIRRTPNDNLTKVFFKAIPTENSATACIECMACEAVCPQHLPIVELLKKAPSEFE